MTLRLSPVYIVAVLGLAFASHAGAQPLPATWTLDWSDEFDGSTLDPEAWNIEEGEGSFGGDAMVFLRENVTVNGGILRLQARREASGGKPYTSGAVTTRHKRMFRPEFKLEVRAQIPAFRGGWPAIWTREWQMPEQDTGVEIDLMENIGDGNVVYQTQHIWDFPAHQQVTQCAPYKVGYATSMHTYAVEVTGGQTRWFIDGVQTCGPTNVTPATYSYLILDLAVGGSWPGPPDAGGAFPQNFNIDYVRLYRRGPDTTAPSVSLTTPAAGTTVSGTTAVLASAADNIGVASVQFTLNDVPLGLPDRTSPYGANWNTTGIADGTYSLRATARDGAGNETTSTARMITVNNQAAAASCPCSLWDPTTTPTVTNDTDTSSYEMGVRFAASVPGQVTGVRFYKSPVNTGSHTAHLWTAAGTLLASATFTDETASGWQTAMFASPVTLTAGTTYVASYYAPNQNQVYDAQYFTTSYVRGPLAAPAGVNGVFKAGSSGFPSQVWLQANFWVDVVFETDETAPSDTTPPTVVLVAPAPGAVVPTSSTILVQFSEPMLVASVTPATVTLTTASSQVVASTISYNSSTRVATLTPQAALAAEETYSMRVTGGDSGVKDLAGNALASTLSWGFTTQAPADTTPPVVTAVSPVQGAALTMGASVLAEFSEPMLASSVTTATVRLRDRRNRSVTSTVTYNASTRVATLTPVATLSVGSTYTAQIIGGSAGVKDLAGNALASTLSWTFTAQAAADTTPPTVTGVQASEVGPTKATVTWTTNEPSDTRVEYGTTAAYGATSALVTAPVTSHAMALTGLQLSTTYHYRVLSRDAAGNLATSGDFAFTTTGADTTPPTIGGISVSSVTRSSARIRWTTNESATTQIQYGTTSWLGSSSTLVSALVTAHDQTLTGLQRNRTYYYRVLSSDAAGNLRTSSTGTFRTSR